MTGAAAPPAGRHRDAVDVARVLALALVVGGHLALAVIDRPDGAVRGANLLALHPGWAFLMVVAPMPVFFATGGYSNATATLGRAAHRLRVLASQGTIVVSAWSIAVVVAVVANGDPGIVGDGARIATQPLWFVAAYAPLSASGRPLATLAARSPVLAVGGCLAGLAALDVARFTFGAPDWIGWPGFFLAWGTPWLVGSWWKHRDGSLGWRERRAGAALAIGGGVAAVVLVNGFGYAPALIDAVPGARSNTTPPTLYTAVIGLAQVGVLLVVATELDRLGRRWRRFWDLAGEAAVGVYVWHLTALALCAAAIAAGFPTPERLTARWWLSRPLWWAAVLGVTLAFVAGSAFVKNRLEQGATSAAPRAGLRPILGVLALTAAGGAVGLKGPGSLLRAVCWSALFATAWWLLSDGRSARD